jgi:hypothetical protein
MIEAAVAIHIWLAQPTSYFEPAKARYYRRVKKQSRIEPTRIVNPTFEQEWQRRVCIGNIAPYTICTW